MALAYATPSHLWRLSFGSYSKPNYFSYCAIILKVRNNEWINARGILRGDHENQLCV